ncbi:MAG: excinuclease ABC subunit UvrB [Kiritimatiellae bacterium]|nr:excinuclease ABC subunit UvrB [Kiritimatiellia bacterium]
MLETRFENEVNTAPAHFRLVSAYAPTGDQPEAIDTLVEAFQKGAGRAILRGVTGSGKTFTMANVIARFQRPTLVISHNKTLAAQLYAELKAFFPDNAVEYFISYYDYYQPEAYLPQTDTYIEKDASINEDLERFRLAASHSLLGRKDVIIVASVSCIYGLVSPEDYRGLMIALRPGMELPREELLEQLTEIQYQRNDYEPRPGVFRVRGDVVDIFPSYATEGIRVSYFGDEIDALQSFNTISGKVTGAIPSCLISPAKQFVMPRSQLLDGVERIKAELSERLKELDREGKLLEEQRLRQRTEYDLAMLSEMGYCTGIENYSAPLAGRLPGLPPPTLVDYFGKDFLCIIDESHVTLPQIRAMYNGDQARKQVLVDNGFRLPSAKDNRPLTFDEFDARMPRILYTSATPGPHERTVAEVEAEQVIRPTGLLDPVVEVRPLKNQIDDVMEEIRAATERGGRTLVAALTKRSCEDLAQYLADVGIKCEYLHSDIDAIERVDILGRLRKGDFDALIGVNLLREGLDLPEVTRVIILDADKEGFLRSETALVQTAGRCARNTDGKVILYADEETPAIKALIALTQRHRERQSAYNAANGIVPCSVKRAINEDLQVMPGAESEPVPRGKARKVPGSLKVDGRGLPMEEVLQAMRDLEQEMRKAAESLEFERAALLRDELKTLRKTYGLDG